VEARAAVAAIQQVRQLSGGRARLHQRRDGGRSGLAGTVA
jgi:hypothetical protein